MSFLHSFLGYCTIRVSRIGDRHSNLRYLRRTSLSESEAVTEHKLLLLTTSVAETLRYIVTASQDSVAVKNKFAILDPQYVSDYGSQLMSGKNNIAFPEEEAPRNWIQTRVDAETSTPLALS